MHHGTKSEILECIVPKDLDNHRPVTTAAVLDGAVLVQMLRPRSAVTIGQYFTDVFAPYILSWFKTNDRIDVVWDVYSKTSLKSGTREQRGTGARRRVTLTTKVPGNWASFLRVDLNKQELFMELAKSLALMALPQGKELYTNMLEDCLSSPDGLDTNLLAPCTHEEADTRIFLHVAAATRAGHRQLIVRSSDSDVVVLAVATCEALGQRIDELWIAFGVGRHFRYIPAHAIAQSLGPSKTMALPAFHALTGCDTTSAFFGKGKKTAWSVWQSLPELTLPLQLLSGPSPTIEMIQIHTPVLQRFVLKLYGISEDDNTTVDAARLSLFFHKGRDFDHMPPSSDALHQHLLRVAYQVRQLYMGAWCKIG
ncbi:hypothetical protein SKAU_G00082820 [Synaphobranchus kaupii]|uniref:Uncharacterized protein n=1 Tax=Synaphobranchus kaupii TaxID=118154 RepID=A0A9Q1J5D2_SYNKA|nr:hypothetical protein SKAU_G00082820 [Synaphobranchus kaupii]